MNSLKQPSGWILTSIGEILNVVRGGSPRPKGDPRYFGGKIPWIMIADITSEKGKFISKTRDSVTEEGAEKSRLLPKGTLILTNSATVCVPKILAVDGCIHDGFVAFPEFSKSLEILYIYYYFDYIRPQIIQQNRQGITQVNLNIDIVKNIPIRLPPLHEQRRIVTKIEELLTQLDAGVASLKKVQAQLKRYRQAVLKAAFEGRLTQEWREVHKGEIEPANVLLKRFEEERQRMAGRKLDVLPAIDASNLPLLPEGWIWCRLPELSWDAGYGTSVKCDYDYDGCPVLRIPNIVNGTIDLSDLKYAPKTENNNLKEFVDVGDLLIIRTNGSKDIVGRAALVKSRYDGHYSFASYLIRYRFVNNETLQNWISIIWFSPYIRKSIMSLAATTAGQYNVSLSKLNTLVFPLPPLPEQQYLISEVERCLSIADEVEKTITTSLRQAETLRQSILKRAFEGKLVPQDPNDEPASILLERIKAGKARHATETKKGKTLQPKSPKRKVPNGN